MELVDPKTALVVNRFLHEWLEDRSRGVTRTLEEYQSRYPAYEDVIAAEFDRVTGASDAAEEGYDLPALPRGVFGERYRPLHELGRGGQGVVYLAEDARLGRRVAIKVLTGLATLSDASLERFHREATLASRLDDPGICTVYESDVVDGVPFVVMRHVEGESLADVLKNGDPLEVDQALELVERVARSMHVAHEGGVLHRDLKPGNLVVTPEGTPVVLDFGLARELEGDSVGLTRTGDVFGTPTYMAPEQVEGKVRPDRRADVWSLGVILHEALAGEPAFRAPTREALYRAILTERPAEVRRAGRRLPKDLRAVLDVALEKDRERRYSTALDLAEDLRAVRERRPIAARPAGPATRAARWARREPLLASTGAGLGFAVVALSALGGAWLQQEPARAVGAEVLERVERQEALASNFQGKYSTMTEERLAEVVAERPADGYMRQSLVRLLLFRSEAARALALLDEAPEGTTAPRTLRRQRVEALRMLDRDAEAEAIEAELGRPREAHECWYLAQELIVPGASPEDARRGLDLVERAILLAKIPVQAYFFDLVAGAYVLEDGDLAMKGAEAIEHHFPESARGWYYVSLARELAGEGDPVAAAERAVELDPDLSEALGLLSAHCAARKDVERALDLHDRAIANAVGGVRQRMSLRKNLARLLPPEEALRVAQEGIDDDPTNVGFLSFKASVLDHLGRDSEATYRRILELMPDHPRARAKLAD